MDKKNLETKFKELEDIITEFQLAYSVKIKSVKFNLNGFCLTSGLEPYLYSCGNINYIQPIKPSTNIEVVMKSGEVLILPGSAAVASPRHAFFAPHL